MGHEDDGVALTVQLLEQHQHLERCACVQVTCGLVSQQHGRVVDQRTGNGYTLHLSTRHLVRLVVQTVAQSYSLQRLYGTLVALFSRYCRVVHQWQFHILYRCGLRQQVIVLEHEADFPVSQVGTLRL